MSINFIGVRKQRGPEQKQQVYDPENFSSVLPIKWSDMILRLNISKLVHQLIMLLVFSQNQLSHLKNTGFMKKTLKLLSDF
jgi:hypothetical protein